MGFDLDDEELRATRIDKGLDKATMSEADKMFESLGYKIKEHKPMFSNNFIDAFDDKFKHKMIRFISGEKTIEIYGMPKLSMQELQAINKKCCELGWLDDK